MIRIAVLGLSHEANSFSSRLVDNAYFERMGILRGKEIVDQHMDGATTISGYLNAASKHNDVEVLPLIMTTLIPAGVITAEALRTRADEMIAAVCDAGPVDAVLVSLHGAAVAEDVLDVDGYLLRRIREVVGPGVPVGASLDLHANVSAAMCDHSDVLNTYRTNPHVDAKETGEEVADLIIRTARGELRPTQAFVHLPAAINILCQNTSESPMRDILAEAESTLTAAGVLSVTVAEGYPYADVPEMGVGIVVVTDDDGSAAREHARALAGKVWAYRHMFEKPALTPEDALNSARSHNTGPVLLLDVGDNIGGGSPGDSVTLLNAARQTDFESLLTIVHAPEAARRCDEAGIAARLELEFGADADPATGPPVRCSARVLALHDGRYEASEPVHAGMRRFDAGTSAAVQLDTGQTVILTSKVVLPFSTTQLTTLGLACDQFQAIVAKGVHSPLAGYGPHVSKVLYVDTPGWTSSNLSRFKYRNRSRPMYPFELNADFSATDS
ncbi:M81 family metallopeptidase [Amycolatopsis thermoflava]|uniref:M81 family metallopeptidase n=1 Tax=Amycolatopsis thermoflava TaxID=84480 RepID=UPI003EBA87CF